MMLVHQKTHQFGHGNGRMGVIELNRPVGRKLLSGEATIAEVAQHVL